MIKKSKKKKKNVIKETAIKAVFCAVALRPNAGHDLLILEVSQVTHNDAPHSVGLLWTSDQLVAETST
jgi:hypothetical protein